VTRDEAFKRVRSVLRETFPDRLEPMLDHIASWLPSETPADQGTGCLLCGGGPSPRRNMVYAFADEDRFEFQLVLATTVQFRAVYGRAVCRACAEGAFGLLAGPQPAASGLSPERILADACRAVRASGRPRVESVIETLENGFAARAILQRIEEPAECFLCFADRGPSVRGRETTLCADCVQRIWLAATLP
jgi:hypothetical protein